MGVITNIERRGTPFLQKQKETKGTTGRRTTMDKVFSVEEFSGQFWSPPSTPSGHPPFPASTPAQADPKMNRSESEWAFQRFLQEHAATTPLPDTSSPSKSIVENSVVIKDQHHHKDPQSYRHENDQGLNRNNGAAPQHNNITPSIPAVAASTASFHAESNIPVNSDKFQAFLKSRLDLACAAVALTRAPYVLGQSPSGAAQSTSQQSTDSHAVTQSSVKGPKEKDVGGPIGIPSLPAMPKKLAAQINPATSGSSRDLSDDDEAEGENELNDNMDPDDSKRARRMLSNRESARRSRRRKQEHVSELETQVSELKVENSSLLNRYTDISHKFNEAAVDNRVLKADVETLRAKVKMAEETVKRVTGMNTLLQTINIPAFNGSSSGSVAAVSPYDNLKQHFYEPPAPSNPTPPRHY